MSDALLPTAAPEGAATPDTPRAVVEAFLAALVAGDSATARALVDDDIDYVNVGLPAVKGREQMGTVFDLLDRPEVGFEAYLHAISADGPVVLTERTDVVVIGRLRIQFWVCGRFDVHDGKITLWRDSFDFFDILRGTIRGLVALRLPSLRPAVPRAVDTPPGR